MTSLSLSWPISFFILFCPAVLLRRQSERVAGWVGAWLLDKVNPPEPFDTGVGEDSKVLVLKLNILLFGRLTVTVTVVIFFFIVSPKGIVFKEEKNPTFPEQTHVIGNTAGIYCSLQQENFVSQQIYMTISIFIWNWLSFLQLI